MEDVRDPEVRDFSLFDPLLVVETRHIDTTTLPVVGTFYKLQTSSS